VLYLYPQFREVFPLSFDNLEPAALRTDTPKRDKQERDDDDDDDDDIYY